MAYERYRKVTHTVVMVEYTGVYRVNAMASVLIVQMATEGVRWLALMRRSCFEKGRPPSRANAYVMREAEVTVASPQKYWVTAMPTMSPADSGRGSTCSRVQTKPLTP